MTERFRRLETLFKAALEQPVESREAWLDRAEADVSVRAEVLRLLDADARAQCAAESAVEGAMNSPADGAIERVLSEAARAVLDAGVKRDEIRAGPDRGQRLEGSFEPEMVEGWRLERKIGEGGMGAVYLAQPRAGDGPPAAIKLLRNTIDPALLSDRFEAERRILATLSHPGIARLLGAGRIPDGRPYLVIEYVEGIRIDAYCDQLRLGLRERVELMVGVCEAVHNAHRNLVVHRDLKPSNVLVTPDGVPKLLDFGIAKLLGEEAMLGDTVADAGTVTRLGWMTPSYASPEQVLGEPVRPASDVYSLGVLLYWLLTGVSPYGDAESNPSRLAQAIVEADPITASASVLSTTITGPALARAERRRTTPNLLAKLLAGDLDLILGKALAKEPDRRYGSAGELAADLSRWSRGLPITARAATFRYRAGKFLRRHRLAAILAGLISLLLLVFLAVVLVLLARTRAERDRATQMSALLADLFEVAEPGPEQGKTITAQALLDRGAERAALRLKDQPGSRAEFLGTLAGLYQQLGLYDRAAASLEEAITLQRDLIGERSIEVADLTNHLGRIKAAAGEFHEAEPLFRRSLALRRELLPPDDLRVVKGVNNLALVLQDLGRFDEAEPLYREIVGDGEDLHRDPEGFVLGNLALLYFDLGRLEESESAYRRALQLRTRLYGADDPETAYMRDDLGALLVARGKAAEGKTEIERALRVRRGSVGDEHRDVARSLSHLATAERVLGNLEVAERLQRQALELRLRLLGEDHAEVAESHIEMGLVLLERDKLDEAGRQFRRARELHAAALGADHPMQGRPLYGLALWAAQSGDCATATIWMRQAMTLLPDLDPRQSRLQALSRTCAQTRPRTP